MTPEQRRTLESYAAWARSGDGKLVLEDLYREFDLVAGEQLQADLEAIPHPYRAYVETGLRLAYRKIQATIEYAEHCLQNGFPPDETEVRENADPEIDV